MSWKERAELVPQKEPEIGAVDTFLSMMSPKGLGSAVYGATEAAPEFLSGDFSKSLDTYRRERDYGRKVLEEAERQNPRAAMLGSTVPYIVGAAAGLPATIPAAGAVSGISSALDSKADLTKLNDPQQIKQFAGDVGIGIGSGLALGTLGSYAPKTTGALATGAMTGELIAPGEGALPGAAAGLAFRGITSPALRNYMVKKFGNVAFGVPEHHADRYLQNPDAVNSAMSKEKLAQKIANTFGDVRDESRLLNEATRKTITSNPVPGTSATQVAETLKSFGDKRATELADEIIDGYNSRSGSITPVANAEFVPENQLLEAKRILGDLGDFHSAVPKSEKAIANFESGSLNRVLKANNPAYESAVAEQAQNIGTKNEFARRFGIKPDGAGGFIPGDPTITAINDVARGNRLDRKRVLGNLRNQGFGDIENDIGNTAAKTFFEGQGNAQGSRRAVMGGGLGSWVGYKLGGTPGAATGFAIGSAAGGTIDKYGPQIGKKMLDAASVVNNLQSKAGGTKFAKILGDAAARGNSSYASTYYLLQQSEPEFRRLVEDNEGR